MKWVNHQIVTGVIVYTIVQDPLPAIYSMGGAIIPDKIEGNPRSGNYWQWRSRHRGWSHWPMLYLLLYLLQLHFVKQSFYMSFVDLAVIGQFICIGALLHIVEDAICGKVPFLTPGHKVGIKLFKVGSITEYIISLLLVIGCYVIHNQFMLK